MSLNIHLDHLKYIIITSVPDSNIEFSIALPFGFEAVVTVRVVLPIEVKCMRGQLISLSIYMEGQTMVGKMGRRCLVWLLSTHT